MGNLQYSSPEPTNIDFMALFADWFLHNLLLQQNFPISGNTDHCFFLNIYFYIIILLKYTLFCSGIGKFCNTPVLLNKDFSYNIIQISKNVQIFAENVWFIN